MVTAADIVAATVDLTGFPLRACGRCGGSGHYSFCPKYGTECFQCYTGRGEGSGFAHATKGSATAATEAAAVLKARQHATVGQLAVGDQVRVNEHGSFDYRKQAGGSWVTVAAVVVSDEACGWVRIGDGELTVTAWYVDVTLDNGATMTHVPGNQSVRRYGAYAAGERESFVETAWASVPKTVQKARKVVLAMMGRLA